MRNTILVRQSFLCVLVFIFAQNVHAQENPLGGFSDWIEQGVELWKTPGLAVAVVKDGRVAFEKGFGVTEAGTTDSVDVHTLFSNASTTKAFAALGVAMLVDEGEIAWDDRIVDHIPEFRVADPVRTMDLRVIDILTHRSGLRPTNSWSMGVDRDTGIDRLRFAETNAPVRSVFEYNNDGYVLAGVLIERVSDMPWADFLRQRILNPLGMSETRAVAGDYASLPNRAMPHYWHEERFVQTPYFVEVDEALTAGSMISSVRDMTKWMASLLDSTKVGDTRLLSPETYAELFRMHMHIGEPLYPAAAQANSNLFGYGLGWFLQDYRGRLLAMHTGSIGGMIANVGLMPDERLGVVVFGNRDHVEIRHAIMYEVMDRFLGPTGKDWSGDLHALFTDLESEEDARQDSLDARRIPDTSPTLELEAYVGVYRHPIYGDVIVTWQGDSLRVTRSMTSRLDGTLVHWNYDVFRLDLDIAPYSDGTVEFRIDANRNLEAASIGGIEYGRLSSQ